MKSFECSWWIFLNFFWVFRCYIFVNLCFLCVYVGGPKLRKWYGAPDLRPRDASDEIDEEEEDEFPGILFSKLLL